MRPPLSLMSSEPIALLVEQIAQALRSRGQWLVTAESCTGGLIAGACTDLAGSSDWFERGLVTYSNRAKTELLDVPADLIARHGAVSEPVVRSMAEGARKRSDADWAVAVTGVAGPSGGTPDKPVGTVWLAWSTASETDAERCQFAGDRAQVRTATVRHALTGLLERLHSAGARS